MQISERLAAVSAMVTPGGTLADIGTDHAYIPIFLVRTGKIPRAVAMDVNRGPLARAREHIAQYGLEGQIETRLSDGLAALLPGEAAGIVIAGMGGALTVRILREGAEKLAGCRELILQPQSEIWDVRAWLSENGWRIAQEDMVCEDRKYYPMMRAEAAGEECTRPERLSAAELRYGPLLLREGHPVLREYLLREREVHRRILGSLRGQEGDAARTRRREIGETLEMIEEALRR